MKFAILYSRKDLAGINIAEQLKKMFIPQIPILELKKDSIYSENIDKNLARNFDFLVFATKHKSKTNKPALSLHAPGNWRNADYGGKPEKVCPTSASVLKYLFQQLHENAKNNKLKDYEITLECTHHGPYLEKPCCFIEIGSQEEQWKDKKAAFVIAKTIASLQDYNNNKTKPIAAIGIGGPHYCPNFNKIQTNSKYAIGHIIPQYVLPLSPTMLKEAIKKTEELVRIAILDWKGCGISDERKKVLDIIKKSGLKIKRTSEIDK